MLNNGAKFQIVITLECELVTDEPGATEDQIVAIMLADTAYGLKSIVVGWINPKSNDDHDTEILLHSTTIEVEKVDFLKRLWCLAYEEERRLFSESIKARDSGDNERATLLRGMQMGLARMRELEQRLDANCQPNPRSADERDKRLMLAEEILSALATGYWVSVLDDSDDPVNARMGQRILNYWRTWDSPPNNQAHPTAAERDGGAGGK